MKKFIRTSVVSMFVVYQTLAVVAMAVTPEDSNKGEKDSSAPVTACYILTEGEGSKNVNAVKLIITGNNIAGELKYITFGESAASGQLTGKIKDGIITADWTFTRDTNYYKVPVSFKVTPTALLQKATAVDGDGQPYIPEDGEYKYEFRKVDCKYYPGK